MSIASELHEQWEYDKIKPYVDRLVKEWITHKKIIISVDYDDTIFPWGLNNKIDQQRTIELVKTAQSIGAYIVIFTASDPERHLEIQQHCESIQLPIDSINKNPIPLPYGNNGKIYYNINLCDRSGLVQSLDILEEAMRQIERYYINQPYTT